MSIEQRRKVLRHSSAEMTLHYTHPDIEAARAQIEKIGKQKVN